MVRLTVFVAAIYGALGVLFGAYRAHGLEKALLAAELSASQIAVRLDNLSVAVPIRPDTRRGPAFTCHASVAIPLKVSHAGCDLFCPGNLLFFREPCAVGDHRPMGTPSASSQRWFTTDRRVDCAGGLRRLSPTGARNADSC